MRTIEKRVVYVDRTLTYRGSWTDENDVIWFEFEDSKNRIWTHSQIPVERCESAEAMKQAKIFLTKASQLKEGDKVIVKAAVRAVVEGGVYGNVEKIVMKV
jgi:hypothetical protein